MFLPQQDILEDYLGMGGGGGDVENINYETRIENCFKGTQSGDNLDFFGPNQKHYMTFRKNSILFL
jgi:hypothetical protein